VDILRILAELCTERQRIEEAITAYGAAGRRDSQQAPRQATKVDVGGNNRGRSVNRSQEETDGECRSEKARGCREDASTSSGTQGLASSAGSRLQPRPLPNAKNRWRLRVHQRGRYKPRFGFLRGL